jgi:hypothetical protein
MTSKWTAAALAVAALSLAGCAVSQASPQTTATSPAGTSSTATAGGSSTASAAKSGDVPSVTAKMVCGPDIQASVAQALSLTSLRPPKPTWQDSLYSCTYQLPVGPMTLSVKQLANNAAAKVYFAGVRASFGPTTTMIGLGEQSYGTANGIVVVVKDDKTLVVDTTKLPVVFGTQGQKRTDFAYEIASDVMGCWTGNDY